jgi:hypothetical protein
MMIYECLALIHHLSFIVHHSIMAKAHTPPPPSAPKMSFGRKVLIFFILLIIISFLLDALGVPIVHRSEKEEILEHPHR